MTESPALRATSLVKHFGKVRAVDGLSFEVARGEIFALLGPNGAGKTTTLRMVLGILRPDRGEIRFALRDDSAPALAAGSSAGVDPSAAEIGYLPEERGLFREASVARTIAYFGVLRGMDRAAAAASAARWLDRVGLADRAHERPDALSKGNQQKVQLAATLVHSPTLAILDEPFSGLDPLNQELFLDILRDLRARGVTVVLSAHQMQLVERIADRILVMNRGRTALQGTLAEIRAAVPRGSRLRLRVRLPADATRLAKEPGVARASLDEAGTLELDLEPGARIGDMLAAAAQAYEVLGVHSEEPTLHDLYLQAVGSPSEGVSG